MLTKSDRILILILLVLAFVFYMLFYFSGEKGKEVIIEVDGKEIERIELPVKPNIKKISGKDKVIEIEYDGNRVRMKKSSCRGQICVKTGWIEKSGEAVICVPNRVLIKIISRESAGVDGISR